MKNEMKKIFVEIRKVVCFLSFSFCVLFFASSCTMVQNIEENVAKSAISFENNLRDIKIFFTKSKGPEGILLIPVNRKVSRDDSIAAAAVRELFLGPSKIEERKGIMTEIPVGTRLINIEESEDEIVVNISPQYLTGGGSATMQLRYLQIYRTLKKIVPFKEIYLQVDGKVLKTIGGEGLEVTQPLTKINDYTQKYEKTDKVQP
ncbi:MAG: GerMN domain-containing protein [Candidatus Melainabacteria bacterium]|nr:GerMN domain-containing protein [Candidatus Melainabacteria bacterium]